MKAFTTADSRYSDATPRDYSQKRSSDPATSVTSRRTETLLACATALAGVTAWAVFFRADLVLSHYDAKAHLVVARRVIDNLTPGWQQIGAVWLPLPHLIQILPVQIDLLYRTGASGSFVSILSFAITAYAFARLVIAATGSRIGAAASTALLALNPNLLYLQSTPMTEPLLLAATSLTILWLFEWVQGDSDRLPPRLSLALFAAMWTRYEAWPIVAFACAAALFACWRRPVGHVSLVRRALHLAWPPALAVVLFVINSRITVGSWFVSGGFYVPDPAYQQKLGRTLVSIWWGTHQLSGYTIELVALAGAAALALRALWRREDASLLLPIAPFAAAALPLYAFYEGHPYRIRYMIPVVAACALSAGFATALARRWAPLVLVVLLGSSLVESPPWSRTAPMLLEAQWDRPASLARRHVSACLSRTYRGEKVLASMGSLAHYMQELSWDGFSLADFIHEGNGDIWKLALETGPAPHAGWMLVEEQAEGGDVLSQRMKEDPRFAAGMKRVCEGGGVALYERTAAR
jgi:hypothetical protein